MEDGEAEKEHENGIRKAVQELKNAITTLQRDLRRWEADFCGDITFKWF